jgi:hypothetical protein
VNATEWTAIERLVDRLKLTFPHVSAETIATIVHHYHVRFDGRPVRDFVPLFVERRAKNELAHMSA